MNDLMKRATSVCPVSEEPSQGITARLLGLAGPVWVEQVLVYLVGLSDTVLAGRLLGVDHLAAVTNAAYFTWFLAGVMMLVSAGSTALVARFVGAGDGDSARAYCGQSIAMAGVLGVVIATIGPLGAGAIVGMLGLEGATAGLAESYLVIVLLIAPMSAIRIVGIACLRGAGDTKAGMWTMAMMNVVNVGASWSLVSGIGPIPPRGIRGIAMGTAMAEALGGAILLIALIRGRSGLRLQAAAMWPRADRLRRMLRISLPAAAESLSNSGCQLWFLRIINRLGPAAVAAHGIAIRCEALAFLSFLAFAVAGGTFAGQALGAHRSDLALRGARRAWGMGLGIALVLGVLLFSQAGTMVRLFLGSGAETPGVVDQGTAVLRLVCFALPALATIQVLGGVLRGVGDTRWPLAITMTGFLTVRLPLAYVLTGAVSWGLGLGLIGAWVAMVVDLAVRSVLIIGRFRRGGWLEVVV